MDAAAPRHAHAHGPADALRATGEELAAAARTAKPRLRGWLHAGSFPLALATGIVLVVLAPAGPPRLAVTLYAVAAAVLFGTSAAYHRGTWTPRVERALKRVDHANIFLLIAGTYTPFAVLLLHGTQRAAILWAVWLGAAAGVLFRVVWVGAPRWSYVPLYLALGWVALAFLPELLHAGGVAVLVLVGVGGLLYSAGGIVYGLKRPNPSPRWFGFHEVFHLLTVLAFACQNVAVWLVVTR